ncbi:MAG TPA: ABC transporter permease subunit [Actinocrinis sp.]|uniref:ABC transporter permease subunit n=1 Tax=Actinocrinis sp. TaxID=1920516 RepID=UPI002DDD01D6|nr:ABC transporter permease subunit [Actinocrinis sp.]HEV2345390.1 ABC transporter permease subunit [Actinocrinis sp.]
MTVSTSALGGLTPLPAASGRAGFGGALHSEWTKIRSVRSTMWTLSTAVVVTVGISVLGNWGRAHNTTASPARLAAEDLTQRSMFGIILGQLIMVVFGALAITSEYSTGMIRTALTAQPRRTPVFWSKFLVVSAVAFVIGEIISFASFLIDSSFWRGKGIALSLSSPHAMQAVIGGGLYLAGSAILAFGIGAILRHTAGAITTGVGLLFVVTIIASFLPDNWQSHFNKWLPFNSGGQAWATQHVRGTDLGAWTGFGVFMIYGVVAVLIGMYVFRKRDA